MSIAIGAVSLKDFLQDTPLRWVLSLDEQLRSLDWTSFDSGKRRGRPPHHPRILAGLIVYGMMRGQSSLRQLETLAATDLGAWWICGGLRPDHSTIGDFVVTHAELLASEVFVQITRALARSAKLNPSLAAIDGTVIEAAGSRFQILRSEAAEAAREQAARTVASLEETGRASASSPDTPPPTEVAEREKAQQRLAHCEAVVVAVHARAEARALQGHGDKEACVCATDLEAVIQPRKDKLMRPGWKPSVIVHPSGLVIGQGVDPSSEPVLIPSLLAQHQAVLGGRPETALLDSGYLCESALNPLIEANIDTLCPPKESPVSTTKKAPSKFPKQLFVYQSESNTYRCPQQRLLVYDGVVQERSGLRAERYVGRTCEDCPQRAGCTTSGEGRSVKRYASDTYKEALAQIMQHPQAKALYRRRLPMVEPIFSALRERQGLVRFHRRGRKGVAAEFALHCIAYNLRKALRLAARRVPRTPRGTALTTHPRGQMKTVVWRALQV